MNWSSPFESIVSTVRLAERGTDGSRGFQPTVEDVPLGGVAERRMNARRGGRSGVATRRGCGSAPYRGLKPTATVTASLRDEEFPSPEGAQENSPGQRLGFGVAENREICQALGTGATCAHTGSLIANSEPLIFLS